MSASCTGRKLQEIVPKLFRPFGTWLGFTGLYALAGGACPCCGLPSCPVGLAGAGIIGGLLTTGLHLWQRLATAPPRTLAAPQTQTTHDYMTHEETAQ